MASRRTASGARERVSARARGLRTLQHQMLSTATRYAIETEVWYRGLIAEREAGRGARWATKDQVHDDALAWFLQRHRRRPFRGYTVRRGPADDLTFWIDSKLVERARRMAERDGVRLARLVEAALGSYVEQHVPARLLVFRRWIQQKACSLYRGRRPGTARRAPRNTTRGAPRSTRRNTTQHVIARTSDPLT